MTLEPEKWHGPVLSGYGTHLVYVHARLESPPPTFEQVAERVREDLVSQEREQLNQEYIESLLARYNVVIAGDDSDGDQAVAAEASE
jgi:peptidyl-prolyl cis-trans isomerase C